MMNKSIEEIRIENEKLYDEYLIKCEDLQPQLRDIQKEFKDEITINKVTKEQYEETIKEMAEKRNIDTTDFLDYESYLENTEYLYKKLISINSTLTCHEIDLKERYDYNNKNKVLSYYYELHFINDYVNSVYELLDEYNNER